jgi:hypothetical protein
MRMPPRASTVAPPLLALGAWAVVDRERASRLASRTLVRLHGSRLPQPPEPSRLYTRGGHRLEAHLARRRDGRRVVVVVPVDGSRRSSLYDVDERRPWPDFERQAGLRRAAWGPCLDLSAGL